MNPTTYHLELPAWCQPYCRRVGELFNDDESRMRFTLELAEQNIRHGGGPFGAAVFDADGRLLSIGINLVTSSNCAILHAEMVALILAEKQAGHYDLSDGGQKNIELVSSCEPCTMCLGALIWSGIRRLVYAALDEDARAIGFDEGPKPDDVVAALNDRGIAVTAGILRDEAVEILQRYKHSGQPIYNAGELR